MKNKHYSNGDFAKDLKNSYKKPAKKSSVKKKDASYGLSKTGGAYVRNYKGFGKPDSGPTIAKAMANGSGTFEPGPGGGQYNVNPALAPKSPTTATPGNVAAKRSKKSKAKSSKKEKSTKKKVSNVLQKSSMCKECKTSHPKGKHMKASGVKKKN